MAITRSGKFRSVSTVITLFVLRIVGWGQTASGVKYWRVANSWGTKWGMGGKDVWLCLWLITPSFLGFFNMVRGTNNCGFEAGIVAGGALKD